MPILRSPKRVNGTILDDPKSLQNTEEQVKDVLANLSIMSPNRSFQAASPTRSFQAVPPGQATPQAAAPFRPIPSFSPATSPMIATGVQRTSSDIVMEYKYGQVSDRKRSDYASESALYASKEDAKKRREEL